ncbi:hypothetical protein GobsT_51460 [Gemmata obscuriglobus]|uniref:TIGR02646 family protein n=1 Tax=Gemmata obscuriglobus TaxID=114 RepID=A0A2Z3H5R3_9BACT|nr:hypothetical protein [Gemmata obscuriglobus]AWM36974.1 hypothetical protein C1280_08030 [Gemmata obscuriglobus]QEG30341.1 hypothetical protein GobsT_51460 [Gemmata obscuriglobus]VTS09665.1 Uncharacterized protein OS=Mesorhizobium opportunistum (strain LMG 24607 / HAMBI 3007 / WSM2075) GN=Mesop_5491 PE=4 SV=1 [Gemmata obscuriglobus UQM 2246]
MIRIVVTEAALRARIEELKAGWEGRMKALVTALRGNDDPEFQNEWSDIKEAYIEFQHSKCAFCEKPLEGKIEQDVEHFRPKGAVVAWPVPGDLADEVRKAGFRVVQPPRGSKGYKYLAYHPLNYLTACKTCNSIRKKNYFPIAGRRRLGGRAIADLAGEQAYLIYPLSDLDADPEHLIEFIGITPRPKAGLTVFERLRARVTIEFFGLDNVSERKDLLIDRFETLEKVYLALKGRTEFATAADRNRADQVVTAYQTSRRRHTNCIKHFVALFTRHPEQAEQLYQDAVTYLKTVSS